MLNNVTITIETSSHNTNNLALPKSCTAQKKHVYVHKKRLLILCINRVQGLSVCWDSVVFFMKNIELRRDHGVARNQESVRTRNETYQEIANHQFLKARSKIH